MSAVATAIIGGAVIGGAASAYGANKQSGAAAKAANLQEQQYEQTREDEAPWRNAGSTALGSIGDLMGTSGNTGAANYGLLSHQFNADDLKTSLAPNYQFQLDQGLGAATNAGNAAGFSGNTLKGVNDYAQNYAGGAYQQAFSNYTANQTNMYNRASNLAGLGQAANQVTGTQGTIAAQNAGNFATSGAAASAAGVVGTANAIGNGLGNYAGWNYLNSGARSSPSFASTGGYDFSGASSGAAPGYTGETNFADGGPVRKFAMGGAVNPIGDYMGWGGPQSIPGQSPGGFSPSGVGNDYDSGSPGSAFAPQGGMPPPAPPRPQQPTQMAPQMPPPQIAPQPVMGGGGMNAISNFGRPNLMRPMQPPPGQMQPMGRAGIMPVGPMGVRAMQGGGEVIGPGGPKSDDVPAMLSNNEHVWDAASVDAMGDGDNDLGQKRLTYIRDFLKYGRKQ